MEVSRPTAKAQFILGMAKAFSPANEPFPTLQEWLIKYFPEWDWTNPFHSKLIEILDRVTSGELKRVMIFAPPRHGKTELISVRYPLYRMMRQAWLARNDPRLSPVFKTIFGTYNVVHANRISSIALAAASKINLKLGNKKGVKEWNTASGGNYLSSSVDSGVTGTGAHLIVIDDPIKGVEQANSPVYRDKIFLKYSADYYTRLEPDAPIILTFARWHQDDLAGRIIESEDGVNWEVFNFPAIAETQEERDAWAEREKLPIGKPDPCNRRAGEALWPARFTVEALKSYERVVAGFYGLYMGHPQPLKGTMFQRDWFKRFIDIYDVPQRCHFVRYWDKAGTADGGANTAGVLMAFDPISKWIFVVDVVAGQWDSYDREAIIKYVAKWDVTRFPVANRQGRYEIWIEQEGGSGGKESAQNTIRNLMGYKAYRETVGSSRVDNEVGGAKVVRAGPFAAYSKSLNVVLVRDSHPFSERLVKPEIGGTIQIDGKWNAGYIGELISFPTGKYKDRVDASSGAFNKLARIFLKSGRAKRHSTSGKAA